LGKYSGSIGGFAVRNYVHSEEWKGVNEHTELVSSGTIVKPSFFYFKQLSPFPGVVFNRELGMKLKGFNVPLHPIADLDFWRRLTENSVMLYIDQNLAYYRISPNQSTNRLIDDMINNVYKYRLDLSSHGKIRNNLLTRMGIEYVRITGIDFFVKQYPHINITTDYPNYRWMKRTRMLMNFPYFSGIMRRYIQRLSYGKKLSW
jgi:hypothetical protein